MEDKARMIAAARRMARRIAKKTELTYQQALDQVARDLGRDHWAHYASDPLPVPRQTIDPQDVGFERRRAISFEETMRSGNDERVRDDGRVAFLLAGRDWNALRPGLEGWLVDAPFLPAWNALSSRYVGRGVSTDERESHVKAIAHVLIPDRPDGGARYFDDKGREALQGFLLAEVFRSWREGREASIPDLLDWIRDEQERAGVEAGRVRYGSGSGAWSPEADGMRMFLNALCGVLRDEGHSFRAVAFLQPLVDMSPRERSGVLGTMDQGLLPFRNPVVRAMNS